MPDDDRVVANEDVLDDEAHDSLALIDVKRVGGAAQTTEECRESLGKAKERGAIGSLVSDRLQLGAQRLFALPQRGQPRSVCGHWPWLDLLPHAAITGQSLLHLNLAPIGRKIPC